MSEVHIYASKRGDRSDPATATLGSPAVIDLAPLLGILLVAGRSPLLPAAKPLAIALAIIAVAAPAIRPLPYVTRFAIALGAVLANFALGYPPTLAVGGLVSALHKVSKVGPRAERVALLLLPVAVALPAAFHAPVTLLSNQRATSGAVVDDLIRVTVVVLALRLLRRTALQEARLETATAEAAAGERARIARELHDVVAHHVSVVVVQAQAAQAVLSSDEEQVGEALHVIESTAREAMTELRRVLGVLRTDDVAARAPQPTLNELRALADQVGRSGLKVNVTIDGNECSLAPGVALSAYRIVQEALTNVLRHAHATSADVVVSYGRHALEVVVTDDGHGDHHGDRPPSSAAGGQGLVGMRERVSMLGGTFSAGNAGERAGYRVQATLPYGAPTKPVKPLASPATVRKPPAPARKRH